MVSIQLHGENIFALHTKTTTYVLGIDEGGILRHLYWGGRIERIEDFTANLSGAFAVMSRSDATMEEFSSFGGLRGKDTSFKVAFADRTRDFRYRAGAPSVEGNLLRVCLKDVHYPLEVTLCYRVYEEEDIIERWCEVKNGGDDPVRVERLYSAEVSLPGEGYQVMNYHGRWGAEQQPVFEPVCNGKKVFESIHGLTAHGNNPFFVAFQEADEDHGEVFFGALAYLGNFKVTCEATPYQYLNVLIGMSDQDFCWDLRAGESLSAPPVYLGYTNKGFTGMTHQLTRFAFERVMPKNFAKKPLPVLYNSWYATTFSVFGADQKKLADKAAAIGTELFMIDDGWFGMRHDDTAGLGDWYVNPEKFPDGLNDLIDHCHKLGMEFGLWIEPEMVNPDSDLYRAHPDWAFQYPSREITTGRNQYVLNLTKPEVVDYVTGVLDKLLCEYRISCVKWDMNRYLGEALSASGQDGRVWREYADGVERIISALRGRHPDVSFEACAGGGGRVGYGAMRHFDMYWPSDNVDAVDRLAIQEGYSYLYPIKYMRAWVTDMTNSPLEFRCHCSMCGAYGMGSNLNKTSPEDLEILKKSIAQYKRIRDTVQFGRLYRLLSLKKDPIQALSYVDADGRRAVLFAFQVHPKFFRNAYTVRLKGIHPTEVYRCRLPDGSVHTHSGAYLMNHGVDLALHGDFASCVLEFELLKEGQK